MVSLPPGRPPTKKPKIPAELLELATPQSIFKTFSFCDRSRGMGVLPKISAHLNIYYICKKIVMKKDYSDIPFKNYAIDRLTDLTTVKPLDQSYIKGPLISRIIKSKVGREYEPKVRKRHMKP